MENTHRYTELFSAASIETKTSASINMTSDFRAKLPLVIVLPKHAEELERALKILNSNSIPFHVVSRGHNWGYGDLNLNSQCEVLVNLKNMDRILKYDESQGMLLVEPGVSQIQVSRFLIAKESSWVLDVTGADQEASIVGNFLERGFGHSSYGDHESHGKILEAMTVAGERFCPQLVSSGSSHVKGLYHHDVALNLEKMFYQTHLAIVTKYWVRLKPKNTRTDFAILLFNSDENLQKNLPMIGKLKSQNVINSIPHIGNSGRAQQTSASSASIKWPWIATLDISGPTELVRARRKILRRSFSQVEAHFFSSSKLNFLRKILPIIPSRMALKQQIQNLFLLNKLYSGQPVDDFVHKVLDPNSPTRKKMKWLCPLLPLGEDHFLRAKGILSSELESSGIPFSATVSLVSDRCCVLISEVSANANDAKEIRLAEQAFMACHAKLQEAGYPFYRYGFTNGDLIRDKLVQEPQYYAVYKILKQHFDPKNLLSRGRWGI